MEVVSKQQSSRRATPFQATLHLRPATLSPYSLHACRLGNLDTPHLSFTQSSNTVQVLPINGITAASLCLCYVSPLFVVPMSCHCRETWRLGAVRPERSVIYSSRQRGSGDDSVASPLRLTALRHNQSQMLQERSRKRSYKLRVAIET
ncbi:uncharacterized protein LOC123513155 isoform X1 [Portunus trituberculatus]|uniref:uncharacterized protein LOC123513155 isoform X1 n=1 Tax=Portunus trituberculatus TaxID=210409 RepID=UPI001E1D034C|nr:uncharacterized protein LOC123513155 isoform X1 [Portunus trituberculatus]